MSDTPTLALLAIYMLATVRVVGVLTGDDEISAAYVLRLKGKINPAGLDAGWRHQVSYFVSCAWCTSIWVGMLITAPVMYWCPTESWTLIPATGLAASQVTGLLSGMGRD